MPVLVYSETFRMKVRVFSGDKGLLINNKPIDKDWKFEYSVKNGPVTSGNITDGPIVSYVTTVIEGKIVLASIHPSLSECLKKASCFKVDYINKNEGQKDDKTFENCKLKTVNMIKDKNGKSKIIYTFVAETVW